VVGIMWPKHKLMGYSPRSIWN